MAAAQGSTTGQGVLPLEFEPGQDGQVDWGEAEVILAGQQVTVHISNILSKLDVSNRAEVIVLAIQRKLVV